MWKTVDVEAEDIDLGPSLQNDELAGGVDDVNMTELNDEDADALDSDLAEDEELGIEKEESDSTSLLSSILFAVPTFPQEP